MADTAPTPQAPRNPFLEHAERSIPAPVKSRQRAVEKRRLKYDDPEAAARQEEADEQLRRYRAHRREQRDKLLAGPYGAQARILIEFLKTFDCDRQGFLIETVKVGPWQSADEETRFIVLDLVDQALIKARIGVGQTPIEDSLPWGDDPPTTFEILRSWLESHA
jgi:hypothetical protein